MAGGEKEPKTSPRRLNTAQRRGAALRMRLDGARYEDIATTLGYSSRGAAVQDIQRALVATVNEPAEEVRALELQRLDMMWQTVLEVLRGHHVVVSNGRVIVLNNEPLKDTGPILNAVDRLLKIQERRARYLGLDAPKQFEVVTLDALDAQIRQLTEELARTDEAARAAAAELDGTEAAQTGGTQAPPG